MRGPIYEWLIPLLDGQNTVDDIAALLHETAGPLQIFQALSFLEEKKLLDPSITQTEAREGDSDKMPSFSPEISQKLSNFPVSIVSFGAVDTRNLLRWLTDTGIAVQHDAPVTIVVTTDYLRPELSEWNRRMLNKKQTWVLLKCTGMLPWIGPVFSPYINACWECLARRLRWNRHIELAVQHELLIHEPLLPSYRNNSTELVAISTLIRELADYAAEPATSRLPGNLLVLSIEHDAVESHAVVRRPECEACGESSVTSIHANPVFLHSGIASASPQDTGYRTCSPEETLQRFTRQVSPFTGVVRELRRLSPETRTAPVYVGGHARKESSWDIPSLLDEWHFTNSGKGTTEAAAKASALGEAIERYSAFFQGNEKRILSSYRDLGERAIHPNRLLNFSRTQYRERSQRNLNAHPRCRISQPFNEEEPVDWTPVWSLTFNESRFVPTAFCYFGYPQDRDSAFCESDSNGNAAGNTIEEAILQGFFELVERDAVGIWWYNRITRQAFNLDSIDDPFINRLNEFYRSYNAEFWVLDLTTDFRIPVFAAIGRDFRDKKERLWFGFGAHFQTRIAILRALTEMSQTQPDLLSEKEGRENPMFREWWKQITMEALPFLAPDRAQPQKQSLQSGNLPNENLRKQMARCVEIMRRHNLATLVLDQTRPDIQMPVVKVIVPGLRHILPRFAPGRLYDVPVKQGWFGRPLTESELNNVPFLL